MVMMIEKMKKKTFQRNLITYLMVIIAFAIMETLRMTGNLSSLMSGMLVSFCVYSILAVSLNLVVGISGELSLGHAGFMCIGGFAGAFFTKCFETTITVVPLRLAAAVVIGAAVAGLFGFLIGIPVLRLRGDYLAIVTLAFGEIIKNVLNVFYVGLDSKGLHMCTTSEFDLNMELDGKVIIAGPQGISGIPKSASFLAGVIILLITLFIILNLINSRSGRAIMAIRDNRIAAESIGINITKYKLMAFTISAALAGAGGALYANNLSTLQSSKFNFNTSILVLVFVVLGGIGNIRGSIIAAVILTALPEMLRFLSDYRMLIYAIVLIVMMLFNWAPKALEWREQYLGALFRKNAKGVK